MRTAVFAALLAVSAGLVAIGVGMVAVPAGLVVGGVLLAGWSWLLLASLPAAVDGGPEDALEVEG